MLHIPSITIYSVLEILILNSNWQELKETIENWKLKQAKSSHFLKIHQTFWNSPEGHLSIVIDHMNGGSLRKLSEFIGNIPEKLLQDIAK